MITTSPELYEEYHKFEKKHKKKGYHHPQFCGPITGDKVTETIQNNLGCSSNFSKSRNCRRLARSWRCHNSRVVEKNKRIHRGATYDRKHDFPINKSSEAYLGCLDRLSEQFNRDRSTVAQECARTYETQFGGRNFYKKYKKYKHKYLKLKRSYLINN